MKGDEVEIGDGGYLRGKEIEMIKIWFSKSVFGKGEEEYVLWSYRGKMDILW